MKKSSSKTGRYHGKQWVPRSATFNAGRSPVGEHHTASQKSKKNRH